MIVLRRGMRVVPLSQSGLSKDRQFAFYDQVHTTGMDIQHCINAKAALTLGKAMTFRDYAQGAYRMRGIGKGQSVEVLIIPEITKSIKNSMVSCGQSALESIALKEGLCQVLACSPLEEPNGTRF